MQRAKTKVRIFHSLGDGYVIISRPMSSPPALWQASQRNETKSRKYRKFEVCTVDISKDLKNVLLIGGKHLVTSIVVLSAEARAPCQWHTYASRTYKVVRPKIIEWQSTPFIRSLTRVSSLNIFTLKKRGRGGDEVKSPVTASLCSQWGSLINPTKWGSRTAVAPVWCPALSAEGFIWSISFRAPSRVIALNLPNSTDWKLNRRTQRWRGTSFHLLALHLPCTRTEAQHHGTSGECCSD